MLPSVISWKAFWAATGCVVSAAGAALLALTGVPLAAAVAVLVAVGIAALVVVPKLIRAAELLGPLNARDQDMALHAIQAAIAAHTILAGAWVLEPRLWLVWTASLATVGGLVYAGAAAGESLIRKAETIRQRKAEAEAAEAQARHEAEVAAIEQARREAERVTVQLGGMVPATITREDPRNLIAGAMTKAGCNRYNLGDWTPLGGSHGVPELGIRVELHARPGSRQETAKLTDDDKRAIAINLQAALGKPIAEDWVILDPLLTAGGYALSVTTRNPWGIVYPYLPGTGRLSIEDRHVIGYDITGRPYAERLDQHIAGIGGTRYGKSSLMHVMREQTARCGANAVRWIGGNTKLFDSVGPWIEPYVGTSERLPFDWIANGTQDSADMLAAAMFVARWRQSVPHRQRAAFKTLIVEIDEASFLLPQSDFKSYAEGKMCTPSELALNLLKGAGSAGVWLHLIAQRGTAANWGEHGSDINANIQTQFAFGTNDPGEIGRLTGNYSASAPRSKGEYLIRPSDESLEAFTESGASAGKILRLKAPYPQETDPKKPVLHDGPTIADLSWAVRGMHDGGLDEGSARAAGEAYARRRTNPDEVWEYVLGTGEAAPTADPDHTAATAEPMPTPQGAALDPYAATQAAFEAAMNAAPASAAMDRPAAGVASLDTRRSRPQRIVDAVRAAGAPMTRAQIVAALVANGDDKAGDNPTLVSNALAKLVREGQLRKGLDTPEGGTYTAAS